MSDNNTNVNMMRRAALLRQGQTEAEDMLWERLRSHRLGNVHFRRQHVIGNYIVDFCATRKKLIIEVDGGQHTEQKEYDGERTAYLERRGYHVLRFWNSDNMKDIDAVMQVIINTIFNEYY